MTGDSAPPLIAVLDYGIGNLRSAQKALERVGADARLTADAGLIGDADGVVLPGVGHFGTCMTQLRATGLEQLALAAIESGRPFLGICVGMQMLFEASEEAPGVKGLGVMPGTVRLLPDGMVRPQMQWNRLDVRRPDCPLLAGLTGVPGCTSSTATRPTPSQLRGGHMRLPHADHRCHRARPAVGHPIPPGEVRRCRQAARTELPRRSEGRPVPRVSFDLYPAIDLRGGRCVRLLQGDYDREVRYDANPVEVAHEFAEAGTRWIHMVDLDAARTGEPQPQNRAVIRSVVAAVGDVAVRVQVGAGVRSRENAEALYEAEWLDALWARPRSRIRISSGN